MHHIHTQTHIYKYMYICIERDEGREKGRERERFTLKCYAAHMIPTKLTFLPKGNDLTLLVVIDFFVLWYDCQLSLCISWPFVSLLR